MLPKEGEVRISVDVIVLQKDVDEMKTAQFPRWRNLLMDGIFKGYYEIISVEEYCKEKDEINVSL